MTRILLVEDDPGTAEEIALELAAGGHAVCRAASLSEGLATAREGAVDLLIVDRQLPDGEGLALIERLRGAGQRTPALVLSALSSHDDRVRGLRAGGDDYLPKPFALVELVARVEALLRRPNETRDTRLIAGRYRAGRSGRGARAAACPPPRSRHGARLRSGRWAAGGDAHPPGTRAAAPTFDPVAFFAGRTHGLGSLKVAFKRRQEVLVEGHGAIAPDRSITLVQEVRRGGKPATGRTWHLRMAMPGHYAGTLTDAAGAVSGEVAGNRLHLRFAMKGGLEAQQWFYLQPGGQVARNVMVVSKFGLPVARLDETITRLHP